MATISIIHFLNPAKILIILASKNGDKSARLKGGGFNLTYGNKNGFMVDLIQPTLKDVMFSNQTSLTDFPDDLSIVEIKGLDWLVSCPKFNATAIDIKGFPVPITAPDPRAYAMHKLWLSAKDDRNPLKKNRDISQARAVFDLVTEKLSFLKFNEKDLQAMPFKLRDHAAEDFGFSMNF